MGGDGGTCCKRRDIMTKTYQEKRKQDVSFSIIIDFFYFFCKIKIILYFLNHIKSIICEGVPVEIHGPLHHSRISAQRNVLIVF